MLRYIAFGLIKPPINRPFPALCTRRLQHCSNPEIRDLPNSTSTNDGHGVKARVSGLEAGKSAVLLRTRDVRVAQSVALEDAVAGVSAVSDARGPVCAPARAAHHTAWFHAKTHEYRLRTLFMVVSY